MRDFFTGYGFGGAFGASRTGRRIIRVALRLFIIGVVLAGLIYAYVVFKAVNEKSEPSHVHAHSPR